MSNTRALYTVYEVVGGNIRDEPSEGESGCALMMSVNLLLDLMVDEHRLEALRTI